MKGTVKELLLQQLKELIQYPALPGTESIWKEGCEGILQGSYPENQLHTHLLEVPEQYEVIPGVEYVPVRAFWCDRLCSRLMALPFVRGCWPSSGTRWWMSKRIQWRVQSALFKRRKRDLSNMLAKLDLFNSIDSFWCSVLLTSKMFYSRGEVFKVKCEMLIKDLKQTFNSRFWQPK